MKVMIYDNDLLIRERLERLATDGGHEVVNAVGNIINLIEQMRIHRPHAIIINEELIDAFAVCENLVEQVGYLPAIILIGSGKRCLDAFRVGANDYLLSPVGREDLLKSLMKITQPTAAQESTPTPQQSNKRARQYISARTHRGVELISLADVYYFSADQKYVKVCHKGGVVLIDETLKELEKEFEGMLFRIHRNALVNLDYLDLLEALPKSRFQVRFRGIDDALAVSRRHLPALRDKIHNI